MKQCITAKAVKLKCYKTWVTQYRQSKSSGCNQKAIYEKVGGKHRETNDSPQV